MKKVRFSQHECEQHVVEDQIMWLIDIQTRLISNLVEAQNIIMKMLMNIINTN